jgi:hypothetical protein
MLKKILSSQTKTEKAETTKQVANMGLSKETQKLRFKLLKDLERRNISAQAVKVGKVQNIYPIGTRGVYMFAKFGTATDSQKWKLFEYFQKQ